MAKKTIKMIVEKQLKQHRAEVAVLWLLIAMGTVLVITGAGVYFKVSRLAIVQQPFLISSKYFLIAQVRMICNFARVLRVVFSLTGIAVIIVALDRFSFTRAAHRMASVARKGEG